MHNNSSIQCKPKICLNVSCIQQWFFYIYKWLFTRKQRRGISFHLLYFSAINLPFHLPIRNGIWFIFWACFFLLALAMVTRVWFIFKRKWNLKMDLPKVNFMSICMQYTFKFEETLWDLIKLGSFAGTLL